MKKRKFIISLFYALTAFTQLYSQKAFPAVIPLEKPDRELSAAMERMYDKWNPHEDRGNELYSNFKYSRITGFEYPKNTSRRDPSKVLKIDGTYYVWYTKRSHSIPPQGAEKATDEIPSTDWDLAEIWYATSKDGFHWEERGVAIQTPPKGNYSWRSASTPDILVWKGKYYLYYQGFNAIPGLQGDRAAATIAWSDSPDGPWEQLGRDVVTFGEPMNGTVMLFMTLIHSYIKAKYTCTTKEPREKGDARVLLSGHRELPLLTIRLDRIPNHP
ncbi:hypothetical protein ACFLSA_06370 [Bacteroidota bacterium]